MGDRGGLEAHCIAKYGIKMCPFPSRPPSLTSATYAQEGCSSDLSPGSRQALKGPAGHTDSAVKPKMCGDCPSNTMRGFLQRPPDLSASLLP